jgi:hypothetical protein
MLIYSERKVLLAGCWLVAGGWFVLREKDCWLVADKPSDQSDTDQQHRSGLLVEAGLP